MRFYLAKHTFSMRNISLVLSLQFVIIFGLLAQDPAKTADAYEKNYNARIQKEYLFGTYIPQDLTDAYVQLNKLISDESKKKFKNASEDDAVHKLHFSLGRWMAHNWGFYGGSRLSHFLNTLGLKDPDDMTTFIIRTYHRNLNKKPLDAEKLINELIQKRKEAYLNRKLEGEVLYEETKKVPPNDGQ